MPYLRISRSYALLASLALAAGCGPAASSPAASAADHDRPVPESVPRKKLALSLDLPPSSECEERFDLALYQNRAVELIAWDDHTGACADRDVTIRYLADRLEEKALMDLVREHAKTVRRSKANKDDR
jgi:hypothetical protein